MISFIDHLPSIFLVEARFSSITFNSNLAFSIISKRCIDSVFIIIYLSSWPGARRSGEPSFQCAQLLCERSTYLPVMAKWIDHATQAPAICILHRVDLARACRNRLREDRIGIRHGQDHPYCPTAKRIRAEVAVFRRFVAQPELRASD